MIENELVSMNWNTRIRDSCRIEEINAYSCSARSCEIYFFDINFTAQTSPVNMWIHWRTMEWRPLWTEKMIKKFDMKEKWISTEQFHSLHDSHLDHIVSTNELVQVYDNYSILQTNIIESRFSFSFLPFSCTWICWETVPRELVAIHS